MVLLIVGTLILGAVTGLVSIEARSFVGLGGQILHVLLSIICFILVGIVFWRFGLKVGLIDLALLFIAGNVGHSFS
jgi:hypothetical protein